MAVFHASAFTGLVARLGLWTQRDIPIWKPAQLESQSYLELGNRVARSFNLASQAHHTVSSFFFFLFFFLQHKIHVSNIPLRFSLKTDLTKDMVFHFHIKISTQKITVRDQSSTKAICVSNLIMQCDNFPGYRQMGQSMPGIGGLNTEQVIEMCPNSWASKLTIISCNLKHCVLQGRGNCHKGFCLVFF